MITIQLTENECLDLMGAISDGIKWFIKNSGATLSPGFNEYQGLTDADKAQLERYKALRRKVLRHWSEQSEEKSREIANQEKGN